MHSEALRKAIILAVSNLLASNYPKSKDVLAKLCVPSDIRIDMNLAILSATLPRIQNLSIPKSRKYASELIDMISAPDLSLALAIVELCTGSEHEGVLDLLLYILSASGLATKFLKAVVEQEISTTGG